MTVREILERSGKIDVKLLNRVATKQRTSSSSFAALLLEEKTAPEDIVLDALAKSLGYTFYPNTKDMIFASNVAEQLRFNFLSRNRVAPMIYQKRLLMVFEGTAVENKDTVLAVRNSTRETYEVCVVSSEVFRTIAARYIQPRMIGAAAENLQMSDNSGVNTIDLANTQSDVGYTVYNIIQAAYDMGASDIHIEPYEREVKVFFKIDGKKILYGNYRTNIEMISQKLKVDAAISNTNRFIPSKGKLKANYGARQIDLRINIIPSKMGDDINMRILSNKLVTIDKLGMSKTCMDAFNRALRMTKGLILMVGPTGSGKSTTLYAGINEIKQHAKNICCIEDPVELQVEGITQVDVTNNLSFSDGVATFLRHDADVMIIGEIREIETAKAVFEAASTGHLVISTLHTNTALSSISRLYCTS